MKRIMMFLVFSMLASFAMAQQIKDISSSELDKKQQQVWDQVIALNNAVFATKDAAVMNDLVTSELQYGHSGGKIEDKKTMVHNASTSATLYTEATTQRLSLKVKDDVAMVRYIFKAISTDNGVGTPLELGLLQVWVKQHGKWQLDERQAVKLNVKKA